MGQVQRYQTTYECDAVCEETVITYDHKNPEGWFWGNVSHINDKGQYITYYYYACSLNHVTEAFNRALSNLIKKEETTDELSVRD